jgi:hypothetical protein
MLGFGIMGREQPSSQRYVCNILAHGIDARIEPPGRSIEMKTLSAREPGSIAPARCAGFRPR